MHTIIIDTDKSIIPLTQVDIDKGVLAFRRDGSFFGMVCSPNPHTWILIYAKGTPDSPYLYTSLGALIKENASLTFKQL